MTPVNVDKETPLRATLKILAWILFVITAIALIAFSIHSSNQQTKRTGGVFTINSQPRALPNVRMANEKQQVMTLQDLRGRIVLLNVWATWCPPCRREMPALDRLQDKLGGPDFEVVALSVDQGPQGVYLVQEFYLQTGIKSLKIHMDSSSDAFQNLGVAALPTTLLIDREGREIGRKIGPAEWDSPEIVKLIRDYLNALVSEPTASADDPEKVAQIRQPSQNATGSLGAGR